jgi:hypothetical protein
MLPLTLPLALWIMIATTKNRQKILTLTVGMVVGFLPNAIFDYLVFGNPLLPPNLAGSVSDTMPLLSITNLLSKLWFYLGSPSSSIFLFTPVVLYGILGILSLKKSNPWLMRLLTIIPTLQLLHISSMETIGGFQYGPRYLLPTLACVTIGIAVWLAAKHRTLSWTIFGILLAYSVGVALIGAVQTVMYPMPGPYAPIVLLRQIIAGNMPEFRMFWIGMILSLLGSLSLYLHRLNTHK